MTAEVMVKLLRPFDREPGNHIYGDPFDSEVDRLIGGADRWSPPRGEGQGKPAATIGGVTISLHEDGPELVFLLSNLEPISSFIAAVASAVSAWAATRALRNKAIPDRNAFFREGGTLAKVGDIEVRTARNLGPNELSSLVGHLAAIHKDIGAGQR